MRSDIVENTSSRALLAGTVFRNHDDISASVLANEPKNKSMQNDFFCDFPKNFLYFSRKFFCPNFSDRTAFLGS